MRLLADLSDEDVERLAAEVHRSFADELRRRATAKAVAYRAGDAVWFVAKGAALSGEVVRVNGATVRVVVPGGVSWRVHATLLHRGSPTDDDRFLAGLRRRRRREPG